MQAQYLNSFLRPNANIQPTFTSFPTSTDYKYDELILGVNIQPFGMGSEQQLHEVNFGAKGMVRCDYCKGYMNPMNIITADLSRFQCCICMQQNDIPSHYTPGAEREHMTFDIRPAPHEFRNDYYNTDHYYVLLIENTEALSRHGLQDMLQAGVFAAMESMNPDQNIVVMTYDSQSVSIFDLAGEEPIRYIVTDAQERPFQLTESRLSHCKDSIITLFENFAQMRHPLGVIRNNLLMAAKAADFAIKLLTSVGGKIFHLFMNECPYKTIESKQPDKGILSSNSNFFLQKAQRCSKHSISYTIFLFSSCASDVITVSDLTKNSWGDLYLYNRSQQDNYRFYYDIIFELTQPTVFNCTDRLRISCIVERKDKKITMKSCWKTTFIHNKTAGLTGCTSMNPHKIITTEIELLCPTTDTHVVLQNSLLYTDSKGVKRVRVSNLVMKLEKNMAVLRDLVDVETLKAYYTRKITYMICNNRNIETTREAIIKYCKGIHSRKKSSQWVNDILIMSLALLKSKVFPTSLQFIQGKSLDELWVGILSSLGLPDWQTVQNFLPHLYEVDPQSDPQAQSNPLPLTSDSIQPQHIYIMDRPHRILIYFVGSGRTTQQIYQLAEGESSNNNQLGVKIAQLRSFKLSGFAPISYISSANENDEYLEFMNSLVLSKGRYGFDYDLEQFDAFLN